jgi:hypothetical protein
MEKKEGQKSRGTIPLNGCARKTGTWQEQNQNENDNKNKSSSFVALQTTQLRI